MPLTPLHFGLLPVLNPITKVKPSAWAFVLTNVVVDVLVMVQVRDSMIQDMGGPAMVGTLDGVATHTLCEG